MRAIGLSVVALLLLISVIHAAQTQPRTIEILADKDSQYKIDGKASPTITLHAGEQVKLVITARKAKSMNRDGSVHGFALLRAKDGAKVPEWDLLLHQGVQEYVLQAPEQPGEYHVVCTVICSSGHEDMTMTVIVTS
jgi:heme/copper-type cytochrome/quinol oxidase subunit 2